MTDTELVAVLTAARAEREAARDLAQFDVDCVQRAIDALSGTMPEGPPLAAGTAEVAASAEVAQPEPAPAPAPVPKTVSPNKNHGKAGTAPKRTPKPSYDFEAIARVANEARDAGRSMAGAVAELAHTNTGNASQLILRARQMGIDIPKVKDGPSKMLSAKLAAVPDPPADPPPPDGSDDDSHFECSSCQLTFSTVDILASHINRTHSRVPRPAERVAIPGKAS